ncbi:MAG: hypothetical protein CMN32_04150 [Saprospirales bacterium]|nr:hypothetical protein [Saprospirales bacterium]
MKSAFTLFATLFCSSTMLWAQPAEMPLLGNWHDDDLILTSWLDSRYNDVWGFVMNGQEYAAIGSTEATHIIGLADPTQPQEVARVNGAYMGTNLVHRDIKEFNGYLYCVADEGSTSTLQIIDLHSLPDSVSLVYNSNEFVITSHNLFIDTAAHRLYAVGAQGKTKVMDISNPVQPVLLASYPNANYNLPYVHDAYVHDNIGYMNCANQGLWVVDFTDPQNPVTLGTLTDYPDQGYNHSGWITDDGNYYFLCDETHGMDIKVVDISDPSDLTVVAQFSPGLWDGEIAHNVIVRGDLLYASYYYNGVQVWDVSDPTQPRYWGYYDTYPGPDETFYAGNWGIYPLLPSNTILASDMQGGLFVMAGLPQPADIAVQPLVSEVELCEGESMLLPVYIGNGFSSAAGLSLSAELAGVPLDIPAMTLAPGDTIMVELTDLPETADTLAALTFFANDGTFQAEGSAEIIVHPMPAVPELQSPANGAVSVDLLPSFEWASSGSNITYLFQLATDSLNFDNSILIEASTSDNSFSLSQYLEYSHYYYWRVIANNSGCITESDIAGFLTTMIDATGEQLWGEIEVYPVPAREQLYISSEKQRLTSSLVRLVDAKGRVVLQKHWPEGQPGLELDVSGLSTGVYALTLVSAGAMQYKRVLVAR